MGIPIIVLRNKNDYMIIRRDTLEKVSINKNSILKEIQKTMDSVQSNLYNKATAFNKKYTTKANSWREFQTIGLKKGGFIEALWCGNPDCAKGIREIKKYSVRVVNDLKSAKKCVHCGSKANYMATFAPAY